MIVELIMQELSEKNEPDGSQLYASSRLFFKNSIMTQMCYHVKIDLT